MHGTFVLGGPQDGEHAVGATEMEHAAAAGRDGLIVTSAGAEEVAEFVVTSTEAAGWDEALEASHAPCSAFHALVVLLQSVIPIGAGPVHDTTAEYRADRPRV